MCVYCSRPVGVGFPPHQVEQKTYTHTEQSNVRLIYLHGYTPAVHSLQRLTQTLRCTPCVVAGSSL